MGLLMNILSLIGTAARFALDQWSADMSGFYW
jgi:hypothetical protein